MSPSVAHTMEGAIIAAFPKFSIAGELYFPFRVSSRLCIFTSLFGMGRGGAYIAKSPANENFEREVVTARLNHREITIRNFGAGFGMRSEAESRTKLCFGAWRKR